MTLFDYVVLCVLVSSALISTLRGLVKEMLSLLSWIVAFVVANAYGASLAALLPSAMPGGAVRLMAAFVALFFGVRIVMGLVTAALDALIRAGGLAPVNRGLGALFGLARGIVIVLAGVILCGMTSIPQQAFWKDALLRPLAESGARAVKPFLPEALARHVKY